MDFISFWPPDESMHFRGISGLENPAGVSQY